MADCRSAFAGRLPGRSFSGACPFRAFRLGFQVSRQRGRQSEATTHERVDLVEASRMRVLPTAVAIAGLPCGPRLAESACAHECAPPFRPGPARLGPAAVPSRFRRAPRGPRVNRATSSTSRPIPTPSARGLHSGFCSQERGRHDCVISAARRLVLNLFIHHRGVRPFCRRALTPGPSGGAFRPAGMVVVPECLYNPKGR
jgi:hypothetical protein